MMWMWSRFFSSGVHKAKLGPGYFNCPTCKLRQPCVLYQHLSRTYFSYFIPLSRDAVGPEFYVCDVCRHEWSSEKPLPYDFGMHEVGQTWRCFKCDKQVPYEKFECPHCGYHLDVRGWALDNDTSDKWQDKGNGGLPRDGRD
jgi:hypothetical protein